jgi:hypothetical protein
MRNRIKLLLIAMLTPLVGYANTIQIISQRSSFEYSLDASMYTFAGLNNSLTFAQVFSKYVENSGALQTSSGLTNNLPTGLKDGRYRVRVDLTQSLQIANGDTLVSGSHYANIVLVSGAIVEAQSYFEKSILDRATVEGWITLRLQSVITQINNLTTQFQTLVNATIPNLISTAKQQAIDAAGQLAATAKTEAVADAKIYTDAEIAKLKALSEVNSLNTFFKDATFTPDANNAELSTTVTNITKDSFAFDKLGNYFIDFTVLDAAGNLVLDKKTKVDFAGNEQLITSNDKVLVEYYKKADGTKDIRFVKVYQDYLYEAVTGLNTKINDMDDAWELAIQDAKLWLIGEIDTRLGNV